jgi:hypothetical protein
LFRTAATGAGGLLALGLGALLIAGMGAGNGWQRLLPGRTVTRTACSREG